MNVVCAELTERKRLLDKHTKICIYGSVWPSKTVILEKHAEQAAIGSKKQPVDEYSVRRRVPDYCEPCSERVRVCQLEKSWKLKDWPVSLAQS